MTILDQIRRARSRLDRAYPTRAPEAIVRAREALFLAEGEILRLEQIITEIQEETRS